MACFEPVVVVFGSTKTISTLSLRLPVSFSLAINEESLEDLITIDPPLSSKDLKRYFVVLLEPISNDVLERLQINHRIQAVYSRDNLTCESTHKKRPQIMNKQLQQFTLDLTADIVQFFKTESEKQTKLERLHLVRVYYRQARLLKEWAMSFAKADPCHILLIPLNSSRENLINAEERLQKICTQLNYSSVIIRTVDKYIPSTDVQRPCLLPYSQALFNHEDPKYICELVKRLSPIRLYLYGNEEVISSEWSSLMISSETHVMEDEDSWCAFIENEYIDDEIKWNIGPKFGRNWHVKRIAPVNLTGLDKNLRFQSALRRAFKTLNHRENEITAEIFDWYDRCIHEGYLSLEPKTPSTVVDKIEQKKISGNVALFKCCIRNPSSFRYHQISKPKGMSFIWLDDILNSVDSSLYEIIEPFQWCFFRDISECFQYIEQQLRQQNEIFLVVSGTLGYELFLTSFRFMSAIRFVYVYCSQIGIHGNWAQYYYQIKGVFNDPSALEKKLKQNIQLVRQCDDKNSSDGQLQPKITTCHEKFYDQTLFSIPIMVYNQEQADIFIAHQRTIDTLLCLPHTDESRCEMIAEFRRLNQDNEVALADIDIFEQTYNDHTAIQWYSRDSFLFRIISKALRSSDAEMMFKMRYFLVDLYLQLDGLEKQVCGFNVSPFKEKLYRGQLMSKTEFDCFKKLSGDIISINTFLSTTTSLQIALAFADASSNTDDFVPILFCIETDPSVQHKRPYANISNYSMFSDEEEVLFAMGSLFRLQYIEKLDKMNNIAVIHLQIIDQKDIDYNFIS
ncbi:unnamed protein product [Rotaria magnacalcarata]|uniref:NAD(P)(+)--arginine ADP-ribosyltransferase n=1 Tax=Rotaria magnacalcarata TaxID=392030 RepID=A0A816UFA9_9BILA|nr:unnamed protein product [Rotaria magnacalcarata]CAF4049793.1 unnamed protein product [Rotaria magnacalcarata]